MAGPALPEALAQGWREHWLERPQGHLRYVTAGAGFPLVLCHGFIGSAENFETWVGRLARRRRLLIPDLPGCGGSSPLPTRHSSSALAQEVLALLDSLELQSYELAGLCLGASVALELLAMAPERTSRLILHTPLLARGAISKSFRIQTVLTDIPGAFPLFGFLGRRRVLADLYRRLAVEGKAEVDRRAADVNFVNQLRAHPRAAREWLRDGVHSDYRRRLTSWAGPLLVLFAAADRLVDLERVSQYLARRPETEIAIIPSAGHGWDQELIRRQLQVLERFIAPDESESAAGPA